MWLAVVHKVDLGLAGFSVAYVIGYHGLNWLDTAAVGSNAHNFPSHTGLAIALGKSIDGLGGSIFSQVYLGIFQPHDKPFLLVIPCALLVLVNLAAPFLRLVSAGERELPMPPVSCDFAWHVLPSWSFCPTFVTIFTGLKFLLCRTFCLYWWCNIVPPPPPPPCRYHRLWQGFASAAPLLCSCSYLHLWKLGPNQKNPHGLASP